MSTPASLGDVLDALRDTLEQRKGADPKSSYVASLYAKGLDAILKKVGEEAAETLVAAKNGARPELVHEIADLLFHVLVLMAREGIPMADLAVELSGRMGRSGHEEKAARSKQ
jgi:phosphoribosyl-ATP pyrophosphohydrolase